MRKSGRISKRASDILYCRNCSEELDKDEGYVISSDEYLCISCVTDGLNKAIMRYPISGAGED